MVHEDSVQLTEQQLVRDSIQDICEDFDVTYWRKRDVAGESSREYDVERYFREARLTRLVPITQKLVLNYFGENRLDLPRSYMNNVINERTLAVTDKGQWSTDRTYDANTGTNN